MAKSYIPITEANKKIIKNFIGMCRMSGLEAGGEPSFTFKEEREIGTVMFDIFYRNNAVKEPSWAMTVKTDTEKRFHDKVAAKKGNIYCYLDSYTIDKNSLEFVPKTSKFNIFSF